MRTTAAVALSGEATRPAKLIVAEQLPQQQSQIVKYLATIETQAQ
jgi:hypothetical protein